MCFSEKQKAFDLYHHPSIADIVDVQEGDVDDETRRQPEIWHMSGMVGTERKIVILRKNTSHRRRMSNISQNLKNVKIFEFG